MSRTTRRYTLAEAREILGRRECEEKGFHRWEVATAPMLPTEIRCVRCDLVGEVTFKEDSHG